MNPPRYMAMPTPMPRSPPVRPGDGGNGSVEMKYPTAIPSSGATQRPVATAVSVRVMAIILPPVQAHKASEIDHAREPFLSFTILPMVRLENVLNSWKTVRQD